MHFTFTGDWRVPLIIPMLNRFQIYHTPRTNPRQKPGQPQPVVRVALPSTTRTILVTIEDELSMDPDPLPQQIAAINCLLEHQGAIAQAMLEKTFHFYPELKAAGIEGSTAADFPDLQSPEDLATMFEITDIEVYIDHKQGHSYIALTGNCTWTREWGIGALLHKDRILDVQTAYHGYDERIAKDSEYTGIAQHYRPNPPRPGKPYMYSPHPKYGKLKAWQASSNYDYPFDLILRKFNEDFKLDIELGLLTVDHVPDQTVPNKGQYHGETLLECACRGENEELIRYILSKKPQSVSQCLWHLGHRQDLMQLLLDAGANINDEHRFGYPLTNSTVLGRQISYLCDLYRDRRPEEDIDRVKKRIVWLMERGADPYIKNRMDNDGFCALRFVPGPERSELLKFLLETYEQAKNNCS